MKQKVNALFHSDKVLFALCIAMYVMGCMIEAGF